MTAHRIEVDNLIIRILLEDETVATAEMSTVAEILYGPNARENFGMLPPGVRWISANRQTFLLEQPPDLRLMALTMPGALVQVPVPYQFALVTFNEDYTSVESLKVGHTAKPRGIQTMYDTVVPFVGITSFDITPPNTLTTGNGARSVSKALSELFTHVNVTMYKLWAQESTLDAQRLPKNAPALKVPYEHSVFVEWWAQQSIESVLEWEIPQPAEVRLMDLLEEVEPDPMEETTLEFFIRVVTQAQEIEAERERLRQEAIAEEKRRREVAMAKAGGAKMRRRIKIPQEYFMPTPPQASVLGPPTGEANAEPAYTVAPNSPGVIYTGHHTAMGNHFVFDSVINTNINYETTFTPTGWTQHALQNVGLPHDADLTALENATLNALGNADLLPHDDEPSDG